MPDPFVDPMNDKITLRLQAREFDENGKPKYPEVTRDVHVTGVLVSDNSVGWETSYYCFMDIRELRELEKEYKQVNKIRDDKNSDNNNGLENYQQVKVKVSDIDLVSRVDQAIKEMGFETYSLDSVREPMQKQDAAATAVFGQPGCYLSVGCCHRYHQHNDHVHLRTHP